MTTAAAHTAAQSIDDELTALMAEQTTDASPMLADIIDPFDELEGLLQESIRDQEESRNITRNRKALARRDLPETEREDLEARVRAWEARRHWETLAHVAVFHQQHCACGETHQHFSHMMYHQQHRTDRFAQRWVRATAIVDTETRQMVAGLPNKVAFQSTVVPICHKCAAAAGFDLNAADALNWEIIQLSQEV